MHYDYYYYSPAQFYNVMLPTVSAVTSSDVTAHKQSIALLRDHKLSLLDQYLPEDVAGDGNCLFQAVSVACMVARRCTRI